ncbi:MAG TPA: hypothetical protein VIH99_00170, partial [Bdellovibrionota bacterium]
MINNKTTLAALTFTLLLATPFAAQGAESYVTRSYSAKTLGKTTGALIGGGNPTGTQTVEAKADVTIIGKILNALNTKVTQEEGKTIDIGGTTYTTVYSFGKRVLADAWSITSNGTNNVRLGLAPTEIRVPFVVYPVGPLTLNVAGGARFQANLDVTATPQIAVPVQDSTLDVNLMALAQAGAFVEAYAQVVVVRGGIGGEVMLIDGHVDVNGRVAFNGKDKPIMLVNGIVQFFNGSFYAFV